MINPLSILLTCAVALTSATVQPQQVMISKDGARLTLGNRVLLQNDRDGFMSVKEVKPGPRGKRFLVIACGYECNDNIGFLFNADGTGQRRINARWDFILQDKAEWSADGRKLFYYRINSSGADPQPNAPPEGWVEIDVATGHKGRAITRTLKTDANYAVFGLIASDGLQVRATPGIYGHPLGMIPADGTGVKFTGQQRRVGRSVWARISFQNLTGWVNQHYLYEQPAESSSDSQKR
jgi:hypothetical protein